MIDYKQFMSRENVILPSRFGEKYSGVIVPKQDLLKERGISTPEQIRQLILQGAEKITAGIDIILPDGFKASFANEMSKKHTKVILVSNHQSHADILAIAKVSKLLIELCPDGNKIPSFQLIIASSLADGEQGTFLQECINQMITNFIPGFSLSTVEYMREKDALLHNEKLRKEGKALSKIKLKAFRTSRNVRFAFQLARGIAKDKGTAIFLPGSVQEGRRDENGKIFGLGNIDSNSIKLDRIMSLAMKIHPVHDRPLIICMGTHGGYKVLSPDTLSLTPETFAAIGSNSSESLIQVRLSMPKRVDAIAEEIRAEGKKINSKSVNEYMQKTHAGLLPPEGQGRFRKQ
jgi:hypothetical protein